MGRGSVVAHHRYTANSDNAINSPLADVFVKKSARRHFQDG